MAPDTVTIVLPRVAARRLQQEAEKAGLTLDEYLVELAFSDADPAERARGYLEAAHSLLEQAERELERGDVRQAAEKLWGAVALSLKAYALWRDGRRVSSHRELWEYKDVVSEELGGWVSRVFREASSLHTCFYEGWCTKRDVVEVLPEAKKLVETIEAAVAERVHRRRH